MNSKELEIVKENEIDLVDLLKVIIRNKKTILIIWILIVLLGIGFGFFLRDTKDFVANRRFNIREVGYTIDRKDTNFNIDLTSLYEDKNFLDKIIGNKLISKKNNNINILDNGNEKNFVKGIFDISKDNDNYVLKISGKDVDEVRELEKLYFKNIQNYLKENYSDALNRDLELQEKNSYIFKNELIKLAKKINELIKQSKNHYTVEELKDLYPTIFAEKDSVAEIYTGYYKNQKIIENSLTKLNDLVVYQGTLNKVEDKMSMKLIFIISNILGVFLGIFVVFVKEFLKGINWKELKELSK